MVRLGPDNWIIAVFLQITYYFLFSFFRALCRQNGKKFLFYLMMKGKSFVKRYTIRRFQKTWLVVFVVPVFFLLVAPEILIY